MLYSTNAAGREHYASKNLPMHNTCMHCTVSINNIIIAVKKKEIAKKFTEACFEGKVIGNRHVLSNNYSKILH